MRGAVDLSSLAQKVVQEKLGNSPENKIKVPALFVELQEAIIRSVMQISAAVPVIVVFYETSNPESVSLASKLEKLVLLGEGKWFLAKVDMVAQPKLAEAFGIVSAGTVAVILAGEPRPLFQGDQSEEDLKIFLERLIQLAQEQGLTSQLEVGETESAEPEVQLSPIEQEALDAMDQGDFSRAVEIYEKELAQKPNDDTLVERLAQVKLVARTYGADYEKELQMVPSSDAEVMRKADILMAIGQVEMSLELLLSWFEKTTDKAALTKHILELFNVAGKAQPEVIKARKALASRIL